MSERGLWGTWMGLCLIIAPVAMRPWGGDGYLAAVIRKRDTREVNLFWEFGNAPFRSHLGRSTRSHLAISSRFILARVM